MLTDQMQNDQSETEVQVQNRLLRKQIIDAKTIEKKLRTCIDELNSELNTKE